MITGFIIAASFVLIASFISDTDHSYRKNHISNKRCRQCSTVFSGSTSVCPKCGGSLYEEVMASSDASTQQITPITIDDSNIEKKKCRRCNNLVPADEFVCPKCGSEGFV